jgi:putative oxidoreductase
MKRGSPGLTSRHGIRDTRRNCMGPDLHARSMLMKFLHLNFLPRSADTALLVLRLWYGLSLLMLHGWAKFTGFSGMADKFPDPLGIGHTPSLALAVFGEVVCSLALVLGAFTRIAALGCGITMAVAFHVMQGRNLVPAPTGGEMAFLYLGAFLALFVGGAGKFSVDAHLGAKS